MGDVQQDGLVSVLPVRSIPIISADDVIPSRPDTVNANAGTSSGRRRCQETAFRPATEGRLDFNILPGRNVLHVTGLLRRANRGAVMVWSSRTRRYALCWRSVARSQ